jgi:GxxExxY protein
MMAIQDRELTEQIIGAFYDVYNALGFGFLEKVYENALAHQLRKCGLIVGMQQRIQVYFDGVMVGEYYADLLVENRVILELKATEALAEEHVAQVMNYLKATTCEVGFVLNFGPEAAFKRVYFSNGKKPNLKKSA